MVQTILDPMLALLYPPKCAVCRTLGGSILCEHCLASIVPVAEPACGRCGQTLGDASLPSGGGGGGGGICGHCTVQVPAFDKARAMGAHEGVLQRAIHLLKYRDRPQIADPLGVALAAYARREAKALGDAKVDYIVPIPMHPARARVRGYNQAERLARVVAKELDLPMSTDLIVRRVNTRAQVGLTQEARRKNLVDAFAIGKHTVDGLRILLIDDVSTTGSSLHACAQALKSAGAKSVYGLTLAAG